MKKKINRKQTQNSLIYQQKKRVMKQKQNYCFIRDSMQRKNLLGNKHKIWVFIRDQKHILF